MEKKNNMLERESTSPNYSTNLAYALDQLTFMDLENNQDFNGHS